jgi:hypothetical protein
MNEISIQKALEYLSQKDSALSFYARSKWLGQAKDKEFIEKQQDFIQHILDNQTEDGSWSGSYLQTTQMLFNLHLTLRESNEQITRAVLWLIDKANAMLIENKIDEEKYLEEAETFNWSTIPFLKSTHPAFLYSSILFTGSIFGYTNLATFQNLYKKFSESTIQYIKSYSLNDMYNYLRAFLVDDQFQNDEVAEALIKHFYEIQEDNGLWKHGMNPYHLVNILAHSKHEIAEIMVKEAIEPLSSMQNDNGSWGKGEGNELETFLMLHALKRIGKF